MEETDELLFPLSAISHYAFCPRRCALIHLERAWTENFFTVSGREVHAGVDAGARECRRERRTARSLRLVSRELGVNGISDVVEFVRNDDAGTTVLHWPGKWMPYPVEYKWGTAKNEEPYRQQLCAQAMCLEERFGVVVPEGALYLAATKHRTRVLLDETLRAATRETCRAVRMLLEKGETPPPAFGPHCKHCSLVEECRPKLVASHRSAKAWLERAMEEATA